MQELNAQDNRIQGAGLTDNARAWAFGDRTEVLCTPSEHGFCPEDRAMIVQYENSPVFVVIGSRVTDGQLAKLAERVDTSLFDLIAYRNSRARNE